MKVMSFNILADMHINFDNIPEEEYSGIPENKLRMKNRYPTIVSLIKSQNPDILLLQEVTQDVRKKLIKDFPSYTVPKISFHQHYKSGNLTMFKDKSSFSNKAKHQTIYHIKGGVYDVLKFSDPPRNPHNPSGNLRNLLVVNAHLHDSNGNIRNSEISFLLREIVKDNENVIIGGDFNTDSTFSHNKLLNKGFISSTKPPTSLGTYLCEKEIIDYIYIRCRGDLKLSGYIFKGECEEICTKNCLSLIGSDHYPVIAIIEK